MAELTKAEKRILAKEKRKGKAKRYDFIFSKFVKEGRGVEAVLKKRDALKQEKDSMDPDEYKEQMYEVNENLEKARNKQEKVEDKYGGKVLSDEPIRWKRISLAILIIALAALVAYAAYVL